MFFMNKIKILIVFIFIFLSAILVSAQSVRTELCNDKGCYDYTKNIEFSKEDPIILKIEIINEKGKIMCWGYMSYNFNLIPDKSPESKIYFQHSVSSTYNEDTAICFSKEKSEENIFYIPLREYNELNPTERIGTWRMSDFRLSFGDLEYSSSVDLTQRERAHQEDSVFDSNEIIFYVGTGNPSKGLKIESEIIKTIVNFLKWIVGALALIFITVSLGTNEKKTKKNLKNLFWIFAVIDLVLWLIS